jgi:hypothetical protein
MSLPTDVLCHHLAPCLHLNELRTLSRVSRPWRTALMARTDLWRRAERAVVLAPRNMHVHFTFSVEPDTYAHSIATGDMVVDMNGPCGNAIGPSHDREEVRAFIHDQFPGVHEVTEIEVITAIIDITVPFAVDRDVEWPLDDDAILPSLVFHGDVDWATVVIPNSSEDEYEDVMDRVWARLDAHRLRAR